MIRPHSGQVSGAAPGLIRNPLALGLELTQQDKLLLLQRVQQMDSIGPVFLPDVGQVYSDSAATTLATADGVVGAIKSYTGTTWTATQATTANKPYLRASGDKRWIESSVATPALTVTLGATISNATVFEAGYDRVYKDTGQTIANGYNIAPPAPFIGGIVIVGRSTTEAEDAIITRLLSAYTKVQAVSLSSPSARAAFSMTVRTTVNGETFQWPNRTPEANDYRNAVIDWGDGSTTTSTGDLTAHTYATAGDYVITVTGSYTAPNFNNAGDKAKLRSINHWGSVRGMAQWAYAFNGCSNWSGAIPTTLATDNTLKNTGPNGCRSLLQGCTGLTSIPVDLFKYNILVSTNGFWATFYGCTGITEIPVDLFKYNILVSTNGFSQTFYGCTGLTSIPVDLFKYNILVSTNGFWATFSGCTGLTSIPDDLFKYNILVSTNGFWATFLGCTGITEIPVDLFKYNILVSTNGFSQTFYGCTGLTSIPVDLFKYNILVSTTGFYKTFSGCTGLTSIPDDLFKYNILVSTTGFYQTFLGCTGLTSIPVDLFKYNILVSTNGFWATFLGCTGLLTLPIDLFRYNTACTSFYRTFYGCTNLQLRSDIFFPAGGEATRFLNKTVTFDNCFYRTGTFTGTQGTAPALWNCNFGTGTPTKTDCFQGHTSSTISNYASIPAEWL